jgi:AhpD family alkylhydroperoxidase
MPLFPTLADDAGAPAVYERHAELYRSWSEMSERLMNGPSPLTEAQRELIAAFVAGVAGCRFVEVAHSEVAYAWGIEDGLVEDLVADLTLRRWSLCCAPSWPSSAS